jgi:hypothetical protein
LEEQRRLQQQQQDAQRRQIEPQRRANGNNDLWRRDRDNSSRLSDQQRAAWRQREEQTWRQRQNDFRRRDDERSRLWQQRQQYLQQQRRINQWRFEQAYWERLRQDQLRLQSFSYTDYGDPIYRYSRNGSYYNLNQYGADLLQRAVNDGYEEGYRAGLADRQDGWQFDPENTDAFQDATFGYDGYYVDVSEYQYYFRQGFSRGYEDGYNDRYQYGTYSNGKYAILGDVMRVILDLTRF